MPSTVTQGPTGIRGAARARLLLARGSVVAEVDTTKDEIVDVATPSKLPIATCLIEAVWAVRLGADFDLDEEHFQLSFPQ